MKHAGKLRYAHAFTDTLGAKKSLKLSSSCGQNRIELKIGKKEKRNAVPVHDIKVNGPVDAQIYSPTRWSALTPQPTRALGKEQPEPIEQGLVGPGACLDALNNTQLSCTCRKTTCNSSDAQPTA